MKGVGSVCQAGVEKAGDELLVEVLANEDELLHAVTILFVPISLEAWILSHELLQLILRHCGVPLAGITDAHLFAGLLEDVACILFILEVADAFGADDAFGPFASHKLVKQSEVEGTTAVVDVGSDAVFLGLALIVVMVVMLVAMMVLMMVFIVIVMMFMLMMMVVVMMMFVVIVIVFIIVVLV